MDEVTKEDAIWALMLAEQCGVETDLVAAVLAVVAVDRESKSNN